MIGLTLIVLCKRFLDWHLCLSFLPLDPSKWSVEEVSKWLKWAEQEFGLNAIDHSNFKMPGALLCGLSREEFLARAPPFTGDILLSHLNLLRARSGKWRPVLHFRMWIKLRPLPLSLLHCKGQKHCNCSGLTRLP